MANIKHAVVRTDNLGGTKNGEQLASVIFYSSDAPAAGAVKEDLYVIAEEELFYDQTVAHYLTEWVNEAGKTIRAYSLDSKGGFSVTAEAFEGTPEIGKTVGYTAGSTKITVQTDAADDTTFGIMEKETVGFGDGKYTYFYISLK